MKKPNSFYKEWLLEITLFNYFLVVAILIAMFILWYRNPANISQHLLYIPEVILLFDMFYRIQLMEKYKDSSFEETKHHIYIFAYGFKRMFSLLIYLCILPFALLENPYIALIPIVILILLYIGTWFVSNYLIALVIIIRFILYADVYMNPKIAKKMIFIGKVLILIFSGLFLTVISKNIACDLTTWSLLVFCLYFGITLAENGTRLKNNDISLLSFQNKM